MCGTLSVRTNSYISVSWIPNSLAFWLQRKAWKTPNDLDLGLEVCFMSQSLADHVWPTQGLQHEMQAICYPTEQCSAFLLPILWQNWGVELRSVLIKHPNCQRFTNPPGSFYGVAFNSIGIQSAALLNHMAQSNPDSTGRIEFAAILSNNIPWMSLPRGLWEEGRRDGESERAIRKTWLPNASPSNCICLFFPTHIYTRLPFLDMTCSGELPWTQSAHVPVIHVTVQQHAGMTCQTTAAL